MPVDEAPGWEHRGPAGWAAAHLHQPVQEDGAHLRLQERVPLQQVLVPEVHLLLVQHDSPNLLSVGPAAGHTTVRTDRGQRAPATPHGPWGAGQALTSAEAGARLWGAWRRGACVRRWGTPVHCRPCPAWGSGSTGSHRLRCRPTAGKEKHVGKRWLGPLLPQAGSVEEPGAPHVSPGTAAQGEGDTPARAPAFCPSGPAWEPMDTGSASRRASRSAASYPPIILLTRGLSSEMMQEAQDTVKSTDPHAASKALGMATAGHCGSLSQESRVCFFNK